MILPAHRRLSPSDSLYKGAFFLHNSFPSGAHDFSLARIMAALPSSMSGYSTEPTAEAHQVQRFPAISPIPLTTFQLATQLYDPANQRNPTRIHDIQSRLQNLQKSDNAWAIADSLLRERSPHHRFMGALTFTVKINVSG